MSNKDESKAKWPAGGCQLTLQCLSLSFTCKKEVEACLPRQQDVLPGLRHWAICRRHHQDGAVHLQEWQAGEGC